jgi:phage tail sheath gpL-like
MSVRNPTLTINVVPASQTQANAAQKILFVGQMTSAGTATSGQLYQNIPNDNTKDLLFGINSMLANGIRRAKEYNQISQIDAIPLDDDGDIPGVHAVGAIEFTSPTIAGSIEVDIESPIFHKYILAVTIVDTATTIGDALVAAITADTTCPVTAVNTAGSVAITSVNAGTVGNFIGMKAIITNTDATVTITGMSGGSIDPVLTNLFDVIRSYRYQTIVFPHNYTLSTLTDLLDARWNVDNNILDGVGIITYVDALATIKSTALALNDQSIVILSNPTVTATDLYSGATLFEAPFNISAQFAAIRALRLTTGANISPYVISANGIRDNVGGPAIASLPYFNTPFVNLPLIPFINDFADADITELLTDGASVLDNNSEATSIIAGQIVTTYKYDSASNVDLSFKYLEYVDTISNIREYFFNNLRARFAQSRLTDGDVQPYRNMANQAIIESYLDGLYVTLGGSDYVLTRIGINPTTGVNYTTYFKENRTVTLDLETGSVSVYMQMPIVTQLRNIVVEMQINFSTNS